MGDTLLTLADVERAIAIRDPELGATIVRYLEQSDPDDGRSELSPNSWDADDDEPEVDVPSGAMTIDELRSRVGQRGMQNKSPTEQKLTRREAFAAAEVSPFAPPRLRLGKILVSLYRENDAAGRAALLHVFAHGKMKWGVWQAAKQIYKLTETNHDIAMFGVLAYRIDAMTTLSYERSELGPGTLLYLRRRVWRHLRKLGKASEAVYPAYCVEVLRHYPAEYGEYSPSWVAAHIMRHGAMRGERGNSTFAQSWGDTIAERAYPNAWKLSPAPLLRLLDSAVNDTVCDWAIKCLRADHALVLRSVEPAWLARLGRRPVAALHGFVVSLLRESPELHQSKLRQLGLHDVVLGFLKSPSPDAVKYALEYAAANAPDMTVDELADLVEHASDSDVVKFAASRLEAMPAAKIGLPTLLRLLGRSAANWAPGKLLQGFSPKDIDARLFVDTMARGDEAYSAMVRVYNDSRVQIPASHWIALLEDPRFGPNQWDMYRITNSALEELGKRTAREIGIPWIQASLENRARTDAVSRWLDAGMLSGDDLDVEWLKTLVGKPRLRAIALKLLGDRRRVAPAKVGLSWLLELARASDSDLQSFAQRMLLESFEPGDFANGDTTAGVARLWELATAKKSAEAVRQFAATYLKAHHPALGPRLPEARSLGITPKLGEDPLRATAYSLATIRPLFDDDRVDVRRLAVAIAGEEIVRWNQPELVYELAGSNRPEPRALGGEFLLGVLVEGDVKRVPAAWLDGRPLFQLAESAHKAAREVALTLIRRLYDRVGGAERLAWLMDSPERDVRLFAVRLFWDRHRPKPWPADYVPRKNVNAAVGTERFTDVTALRQFARVVLFGLPPGRVGERDPLIEGAPKPERALPASVAKRRLIEAMRDVALEDVEFARAISPIFVEFTSSTAKGEWQAALQALVALRGKHGAALSETVTKTEAAS